MSSRRRNTLHGRVRRAFNRTALKRICEMHEDDFPDAFGDLETFEVADRLHDNFYYYADHGSDILFVAHLDTVVAHNQRFADYAETKAGPVIHSGSLDDRLGAYVGLVLLPALGVQFDILLTVGEENGRSTAEFFEPPEGKKYNWVIEFDRKGDDVVMYQYTDAETSKLVRAAGAKVGTGSCSDISYLEHLGVKCFNWGVGYDGNYHSVRGYAYLEDTYQMVSQFLRFWYMNKHTALPHTKRKTQSWRGGGGGFGGGSWADDDDWSGYGSYPRYSVPRSSRGTGHWDAKKKKWVYPDDPDPKVVVNGKEYDSYEEWWKEAHPDEPMIG